jgi:hypothetical protein
MAGTRGAQPLSYDLRLRDAAQADALRLLDTSRAVINQALTALWPRLDAFTAERSGPAWKQVDALLSSLEPHGSRRWRGAAEVCAAEVCAAEVCAAEVVGRLLRAQAERKHAFEQVLPILSEGFIRPKIERRPAGKERKAISGAIAALQRDHDADDASFVALQNVEERDRAVLQLLPPARPLPRHL